MVAISNYQCDLMEDLYPAPKWIKHVAAAKTIHSTKGTRTEALWANYDIAKLQKHIWRKMPRARS
ncbi:MAG: hypothetical protein WAV74_16235 [Anaerolineae bacterium]